MESTKCRKVGCCHLPRGIEFTGGTPYSARSAQRQEVEAALKSTSVFSSSDIAGIGLTLALFSMFVLTPVTEAETPNTAPHIEAIQVSSGSMYAHDTCSLVCQASDPDGEELVYSWSATGGELETMQAHARWTAPAASGQYALMVEVADGNGGSDAMVTIVEVLRNEAPVIDGLWTERDILLPGETTTLTCTAHDDDGHPLTYQWSCSAGRLESSASQAAWTAPTAPGTYLATVCASDGYGGSRTESILINVLSPKPPTIHDLVVRPLLPEYSKESSQGFRLLRGPLCECEIECIASAEGKELLYNWSTTAGSIEGSGATVLFIPPAKPAEVVVSVTVTDPLNQSAYAEAFFNVLNREAYPVDNEVPGGCNCFRR